MSTPAVTPQQSLASLVRGKYPGAYDDMDDATLEKSVLAKYPQYADLASHAPVQGVPTGTISAEPGGAQSYLKSLKSDLQGGTNITSLGTMLHKVGLQALSPKGDSDVVGNIMGGPLLGPVNAAQGIAETPQHPIAGPVKAALGAIQTAGPFGMMVAPEAGIDAAANAIPSKTFASKLFSLIKTTAGDTPLDLTEPGNAALRIQELAQSGGSMPKVVRDFLRRTTSPDAQPLTYSEGRDFYSNATRLSADEYNRLTPVMKREIGNFTAQLNSSLRGAADKGGMGDIYDAAMGNYSSASKLQSGAKMVGSAAVKGAAGGVGIAGVYALLQKLGIAPSSAPR